MAGLVTNKNISWKCEIHDQVGKFDEGETIAVIFKCNDPVSHHLKTFLVYVQPGIGSTQETQNKKGSQLIIMLMMISRHFPLGS